MIEQRSEPRARTHLFGVLSSDQSFHLTVSCMISRRGEQLLSLTPSHGVPTNQCPHAVAQAGLRNLAGVAAFAVGLPY